MTFIERLQRKIANNFPGITTEELNERLKLALHLIAMEHEKGRKASCQSYTLARTAKLVMDQHSSNNQQ